jgi:hypothetical protein
MSTPKAKLRAKGYDTEPKFLQMGLEKYFQDPNQLVFW